MPIAPCSHIPAEPHAPTSRGCKQCLAQADTWVHLRVCLTCGQVGCCDSSKNRHATKHFQATGHGVMQSFQPGEDWRWCYIDERQVGRPGFFHSVFMHARALARRARNVL